MTEYPSQTDGRQTGMMAFTIVWIGQLVSLLGTAMAGFALAYWAYFTYRTATALALVGFFAFAPTMLVSPIAGALVDRWNRKLMMMLSDLAAISSTVAVLLLYSTGNLQIWHLYITGAFASVFGAFQFPAYSAAVTTMVSKKQYGRASGMHSNLVAYHHSLFILQGYQKWFRRRKRVLSPDFSESIDPIPFE